MQGKSCAGKTTYLYKIIDRLMKKSVLLNNFSLHSKKNIIRNMYQTIYLGKSFNLGEIRTLLTVKLKISAILEVPKQTYVVLPDHG